MAISVVCPNAECGKRFAVKDEFAGKRGKCPGCQQAIVIPAAKASAAVSAPAVAPHEAKAKPSPRVKSAPVAEGPLIAPKLVVRAKGFIGISFSGAARVIHQIFKPDDKSPVAVVRREKRPFSVMSAIAGLFGVSKQPVRLEIRETENGPRLFSLEFIQSALSQLSSKAVVKISMALFGSDNDRLGEFRFNGGLFSPNASMTFVDANGDETAEVRRLSNSADGVGLVLVASDGRRLGTVRTEAMSDVADTLKDGKARMSFSAGGSEGHVAEVDPGRLGDESVHRLVTALAVIVEATGIGKKETGSRPMGPPGRRR